MLARLAFLLMFLTIQVSCKKPSVVFVIDETWSSMSDFFKVKTYVKNMLDMMMLEIPIEDILLLTFNETNITRTMTQNRRVFKQALDLIDIDKGNDCPEIFLSDIVQEMALSGILEGLMESQNGSYLYVFTDGTAIDNNRYEELTTLCIEKKSKIFFILTGTCQDRFPQMNEVYNNIAVECGGGVIQINKNQLDQTFQYIRESAKVAKNVIKSTLIFPSHWEEVKFNKRESTDYMFVSASGVDVELRVVDEKGNNIGNYVAWLNNLKALKLEHLNGEVTVKARSSSHGHVAVYGHIPVPPVKEDIQQKQRHRFYRYT